ncbi:carboxypeptidase-like regulatory domain-containing protein [Chryseolinea soli]|nr:carboxypeptidase-like regulatory domain-containing protein [Chryseolinea soli]
MKKISIPFVLFLALAAFAMPGCEKEKTVSLRGDVIGFVKLIDEKGNPQRDNGNAKVTVGENVATSTTEASGRFEMKNVPVGTYTMTFEREGYSVKKQFNQLLAGGNEPAVVTGITLVQFPTIAASDIKVTSDGYFVTATGTLNPAVDFYLIRLYVNDSSNVSNEHYDFQGGSQGCCGSLKGFQVSASSYPVAPPRNTKLYVALYASSQANSGGTYSYYDYTSNRWIDPTEKKLGDPIEVIF